MIWLGTGSKATASLHPPHLVSLVTTPHSAGLCNLPLLGQEFLEACHSMAVGVAPSPRLAIAFTAEQLGLNDWPGNGQENPCAP